MREPLTELELDRLMAIFNVGVLPYDWLPALIEEVRRHRAEMELLADDNAFVHRTPDGRPQFALLMNDVFLPAGDAEDVPDDEIVAVAAIYAAEGYDGLVRWVRQRRGCGPPRPRARLPEPTDA